MTQERAPTDIPGLDEILGGGLLPQRTYLIVGSSGTGKTILSLQWLLAGERRGEKGLYITLAEPGADLQRDVADFGWNVQDTTLVDLTLESEPAGLDWSEYSVFTPSDVERVPMWRQIYDAVETHRPQRLVIDSATQLRYLSTDEYQFRKNILRLVGHLCRCGCTTFLLFEPTELERETSVALAADGVVRLRNEISPTRIIGLRSVQMDKLRGSDFISGLHPMRITPAGIRIWPHRIEVAGDAAPGETLVPSGIKALDELLGGGLESGTSTILSGPTGVGKSTLGVQFLTHAAVQGKRAVLFTFEEAVGAVLVRSRALGIPIDAPLAAGTLKIRRINAMEQFPDEFLALVREAVEQDGCTIVMIDSLRGYHLAMQEYGSTQAHMHNLVTYLDRQGVTSILVSEVEDIVGSLAATNLGVSYLIDNLIVLRYAEFRGQVNKVISCLKKRIGGFQPELRELRITSAGIEVGRKLENLRGILTGMPAMAEDPLPEPGNSHRTRAAD
jgi:circadian clock protein KaiC